MILYTATLLNAVSATGAGAAASWPGGRGTYIASGTLGGSTASLEFRLSFGDGAWVPVASAAGSALAMTAPGTTSFEAPVGNIRAVLTAGAPSAVTITAARALT